VYRCKSIRQVYRCKSIWQTYKRKSVWQLCRCKILSTQTSSARNTIAHLGPCKSRIFSALVKGTAV
jgi:hypothetical protein